MRVIYVKYVNDILLFLEVNLIIRLTRQGLISQSFTIQDHKRFYWSTRLTPMKSLIGLPQQQPDSWAGSVFHVHEYGINGIRMTDNDSWHLKHTVGSWLRVIQPSSVFSIIIHILLQGSRNVLQTSYLSKFVYTTLQLPQNGIFHSVEELLYFFLLLMAHSPVLYFLLATPVLGYSRKPAKLFCYQVKGMDSSFAVNINDVIPRPVQCLGAEDC